MRTLLLSILGGLALAPIGIVVTLIVTYLVLYLRGWTEDQGRRGLMAGCFGVIFGTPIGFYLGFQLAWVALGGAGGEPWRWSAAVLGALLGLLGILGLGLPGLYLGIQLAEHRGVSNYMGERGLWGLLYVALPLAAVGGLGGFLIGWYIA